MHGFILGRTDTVQRNSLTAEVSMYAYEYPRCCIRYLELRQNCISLRKVALKAKSKAKTSIECMQADRFRDRVGPLGPFMSNLRDSKNIFNFEFIDILAQ